MATKIQLTPEELLVQSQEMLSLCQEFEALFQKNESLLKLVNQNWSTNLANNFAGKIGSAQKANSGIHQEPINIRPDSRPDESKGVR